MSDDNGDDKDKGKGKKPIELIIGGSAKTKRPIGPLETDIEDVFVDALIVKPATNGGYVLTVTYTDLIPDDTYIMRDRTELLAILGEILK